MNTRSIGYNNVAYCNQYEGGGGNERSFERDGDAVQHYQSYNETFVDDETCIQNFNQENQCMSDYEQQLPVGENSKLNRCFSTGNSPRNRLSESFSTNNGPRHKLNEPFLTNNSSRNRLYESFSVGNGSRNIQNESFSIDYSPRNKQNEYFPVDNCPRSRQTESFPVDNYARNRQNESFSIGNGNRSIKNESFSTDNCSRNRPYESFSVDNCPKSRPNESFSIGNSTRKSSRRERSSSAPGRRNTTEVLAPIIAQCQDFPTIRRSRSTIRLPRDSNVLSPTLQRRHSKSNSTKTISAYPQNSRNVYSEIASYPIPQRSMVPNIVAIKSERLHSFENYYDQEVGETSLLSTDLKRRVTPNRKPSSNLAVIPPNCRNVNNSAVPLLTHSPAKFQTRDSDFSDRSSPTKGSWLHLPSQHGGTESLWFAGMILLLTGFAICVLCFFLLSKVRAAVYKSKCVEF